MQSDTVELLRRASNGDNDAAGEIFARHRGRLRRMVTLRMNRRLQGRVDPSDVIQDAMLEAARCFPVYSKEPNLPLFLWLRHITGQKLIAAHRKHLGAQIRDAGREVSLYRGSLPEATSESLAAQLLGRLTSPVQAAMRAEMRIRLQDALNGMDPIDREVLALRHFEQLSNGETAQILELTQSAASKRYVRALERLHRIIGDVSGTY